MIVDIIPPAVALSFHPLSAEHSCAKAMVLVQPPMPSNDYRGAVLSDKGGQLLKYFIYSE